MPQAHGSMNLLIWSASRPTFSQMVVWDGLHPAPRDHRRGVCQLGVAEAPQPGSQRLASLPLSTASSIHHLPPVLPNLGPTPTPPTIPSPRRQFADSHGQPPTLPVPPEE